MVCLPFMQVSINADVNVDLCTHSYKHSSLCPEMRMDFIVGFHLLINICVKFVHVDTKL